MNSRTTPTSDQHQPGSPLSQVARNFTQLADDLDRITGSPRTDQTEIGAPTGLVKSVASRFQQNAEPTPSPFTNSLPRLGQSLGQGAKPTSLYKSTTLDGRQNHSTVNSASQKKEDNKYEPYWRDPSFFKRCYGVDDKEKEDGHNQILDARTMVNSSSLPNSPSTKSNFQFNALEQTKVSDSLIMNVVG